MISFYTPWKRKKSKIFLIFLGGMYSEMDINI